MRDLTDFADQAVVLPLIAVIGVLLAVLGWRRGALAWLISVGLCFLTVLVLKLVLVTCGPSLEMPALRSPSGHTAVAAVIVGGIAVALGWGRGAALALASVGALVIGVTRVMLAMHTTPEAALGGGIGALGALGFAWLAGQPPPLRLRWLFGGVVLVLVLLHGRHLDVETRIRAAAFRLPFCTPVDPPWDAPHQERP